MTTTPRGSVNEALLRQMAAEIREEIPDAEVRPFGSHARGDARPCGNKRLCAEPTAALKLLFRRFS